MLNLHRRLITLALAAGTALAADAVPDACGVAVASGAPSRGESDARPQADPSATRDASTRSERRLIRRCNGGGGIANGGGGGGRRRHSQTLGDLNLTSGGLARGGRVSIL